MRLFKIILSLALLLCCCYVASAQYYTLGSDPSSIKWRTIKGKNFDVIYPAGMDSLAREYLYNFALARVRTQVALGIEGAKVPLVLHAYNLNSNATAAWAPRRIDIYTTPPFCSGYADDWIHQLALHEGRHVGQMTHFSTGTFKVFNILLGEQAVGIGMGFYPAGWELEGDAVHSETDFSRAGRGRDANFLMHFRAMAAAGVEPNYDAYRFGSFYNYIPSKYAFGYLTETFMRDNSDYTVIGDIYHDFTRYWYDPSIINKAFQHYTGHTRRKNYQGAISLFNAVWEEEYRQREPYTAFTRLLTEGKKDNYTTYSSPLQTSDGSVVAVKAGLRHISQLVRIDTLGREHYVRPFASESLTSPIVTPDGHTLVWSEIVAHPRWELQNYSVLRSYDLSTGKTRDLTRRTRYFNPAYSPDGRTVAVTEYPVQGSSRVVLLSAQTLQIEAQIPAPCGGQIHSTAFLDGRLYADAIVGDGLWGLYSRSADDPLAPWETEIEPQSRTILRLRAAENRLLFESDVDGITNIYAYDASRKTLQRLTNARHGAFYPSLTSDGTLYWSDYDVTGYTPVKTSRGDLLWEDTSMEHPYVYQEAERLAARSDSAAPALSAAEQAALRATIDSLPERRYSKLTHLVNIHSWAPLYASINRIMDLSYDYYYQLAAPGVTLLSQNTLGTAVTVAGVSRYNGITAGHLNFNYSGLWPIFEINADYNERYRRDVTCDSAGGAIDTLLVKKPSLELSLSTYTTVNLSRGGVLSAIVPQIEVDWSNDRYSSDDGRWRYANDIRIGLRYYRMLPVPKAARMPRMGFGAEVKAAWQIGGAGAENRLLYGYTYGYLPGFTLDQGFRLTLMGQTRLDGLYGGVLVNNLATVPRGYSNMPLGDYLKATADYAIPIVLNDFRPVSLLYLKRVNITPFADAAVNRSAQQSLQRMLSYGSAVTVQGYIFRIGVQLEIGAQLSRRMDPDGRWRTRLDFISGVNL